MVDLRFPTGAGINTPMQSMSKKDRMFIHVSKINFLVIMHSVIVTQTMVTFRI